VPIGVDEHTRGRGLRADQSEFARGNTIREEAFPPAKEYRIDEKHNLVGESLLEKRRC
jgi:hypothetical protein